MLPGTNVKKNRVKFFRSYTDFYTDEDLKDPDTNPRINLTIDDFNAKGQIANPRAPCVVTTVDPSYIKYARQQKLAKKFCMKTDILRLREITRKKFMIYSTQQCFLERQRQIEFEEQEYKRLTDFFKFADDFLRKIEAEAFGEMMRINKELTELKALKVADELKDITMEHQRIQIEVQETYRRFRYLLKLIGYFDNIEDYRDDTVTEESESDKIVAGTKLVKKQTDLSEFISSTRNPITTEHIAEFRAFINEFVRPYLAHQNHLKAALWMQGYEYTTRKLFHFYRHLKNVALLNHILTIIFIKFNKTYDRRLTRTVCLRDTECLKQRVQVLKAKANNILSSYETSYRKDKLNIKLHVIIPVILKQVENVVGDQRVELNETEAKQAVQRAEEVTSGDGDSYEQNTTLLQVEKIHEILMSLLHQLDTMPPEDCKAIEQQVRRSMQIAKEKSRRALLKQTNMQNWVAHFRKHELLKKK